MRNYLQGAARECNAEFLFRRGVFMLRVYVLLPIGPLMREHRLIERMVNLIESELDKIDERKELNPAFVDVAVDFFQTYADRCHHGKEEDILFKELAAKQLAKEDEEIMDELIEEHAYARKTVVKLREAKTKYVQGDENALSDVEALLRELTQLYTRHIEKEDKHFFYPCMNYFAKPELDAMLQSFWKFDRKMIHEKYEAIVAEKEEKTVETQTQYKHLPKWKCTVCGYIYDPEKGDPEHGINAGVPFDELPEDWVCPICSAPKQDFRKL
jgi:hemerythrin-like domain-containing protein/rubredoxin